MLWSLAGVFIKFLDLHPLVIVFYRSLFAALVFMPFLKRRDFRCNGTVLVSVLSYTAAISAFVSANKLTSAANAIVLQYTAPMFVFSVFVDGYAAKKSPKPMFCSGGGDDRHWRSFPSTAPASRKWWASLLALLSGVLFAVYMINLQRTERYRSGVFHMGQQSRLRVVALVVVQAQLALTMDQAMILAVMGAVQLGALFSLFEGAADRVAARRRR